MGAIMKQENHLQVNRSRLGVSNLVAEAIMLSLTLYVLFMLFGGASLFTEKEYRTTSMIGLELIYCNASKNTAVLRVIKSGVVEAISSNIINISILNSSSEEELKTPAYLSKDSILLLRFVKGTTQPLWIKSGELFYIINPKDCTMSTTS